MSAQSYNFQKRGPKIAEFHTVPLEEKEIPDS